MICPCGIRRETCWRCNPSRRWIALVLLAVACSACCQTYLRRDDSAPPSQRFYLVRECPWGSTVVCNSATRLPKDTTEGTCP